MLRPFDSAQGRLPNEIAFALSFYAQHDSIFFSKATIFAKPAGGSPFAPFEGWGFPTPGRCGETVKLRRLRPDSSGPPDSPFDFAQGRLWRLSLHASWNVTVPDNPRQSSHSRK